MINQTSRVAWKRNVEPHFILFVGLIWNLMLGYCILWTETNSGFSYLQKSTHFKPLTFVEKAMKKGLPEDVMTKASEGCFMRLLEAFLILDCRRYG